MEARILHHMQDIESSLFELSIVLSVFISWGGGKYSSPKKITTTFPLREGSLIPK